MPIKSVAVVGSGSVGLYYGGRLAASGRDVRFLVRSGWAEARREGIRIFSPAQGDVHLAAPRVSVSPVEIGPVDLVMVAVKATANAALAELVPPLMHERTALVTLQNGLGGDEVLAERFGADRVLGGLCFVCLTRRSPAAVDHQGHGAIAIGEFAGSPRPRARALVGALTEAGITARLVENLAGERWRKLLWNIPFNGLAVASGGITTDRILAEPDLLAACRALMEEVRAAAAALGYFIEEDFAERQIADTRAMGAYRPSTLVDWQNGAPLEIEPIWGEPLRRGERAGVALPRLRALYEALLRASVRRDDGGVRPAGAAMQETRTAGRWR